LIHIKKFYDSLCYNKCNFEAKKYWYTMIKKKRSLFCLTLVPLLIISILFVLFLTYNDILLTKRSDAIYISSIEKKTVIEELQKGGIQLHWADRLLFEFIKLPKEGWYRIQEDRRGRFYFFHSLYQQKADTMGIVIFAGDTVEEIFNRLSDDMSLSKEQLSDYYEKYSSFLEGEILANKYILAQDADEEVVIRYLLDKSRTELHFFAKERFGSDYSRRQLHQALIMASIIHKESNNLEEMPTIASVINNRLKKGMRLQMDGTLCYGKYSHTVVTPERIKNDTSRFNTYKHKGLPPYPICTVTMDALEAATFPKESDYLYFMLDRDGTHNFASDYDEHRQNIRKFKNNGVVKKDIQKVEETKSSTSDIVTKEEPTEKKSQTLPKSNETNQTKEQNSIQEPIDEKLAIEKVEDNKTTEIITKIDSNDSLLSVF